MRIVTPSNAAFLPSGAQSGGGNAVIYSVTETINANFGPTDDLWFTPTVDGIYGISAMMICTSPATAGSLSTTIEQPAGIGSSSLLGGIDLSFDGTLKPFNAGFDAAAYSNSRFLVSGGDVFIQRTVSGLVGTATYRINYVVTLLA